MSAPPFLLVYHGTRADPERIRAEGLRIPKPEEIVAGIEQMARDARMPEPPQWTRRQLESEIRWRQRDLRVHFTLQKGQAVLYSGGGGELAVHIARYRFWKSKRFRHDSSAGPAWIAVAGYLFGPNRYVVTARLPWDWLPEHVQQSYLKVIARGYDPTELGWDIGIPRDIPPSMIVAVESV